MGWFGLKNMKPLQGFWGVNIYLIPGDSHRTINIYPPTGGIGLFIYDPLIIPSKTETYQ